MRAGGRRATPTAREPDSAQAAYTEAVKRLARQPQSRAALRQRLLRLGYADAAVDAALNRAEGDGYLNDREYAASLVRRRARGRGHALIAQELRAKGIDESTASPALAAVDPEVEAGEARTLGRTLLAHRRPADAQALSAYIGPRLSRRGFSSGLVYRVCRLLSDEWEAAGRFDSAAERD
ncbi:MAG TPA: RecX family transcriptional regulator [Candidatus Dormibacteraeota bacterium]|nr:RecX family transcriptional regulator [Candidatus Dormibacteraeota bacterium]